MLFRKDSGTERPFRGENVRSVVVVPTYNEAETIESLIAAVQATLPETDILVVDDESPDGTGRLVEALAVRDPRIRLVRGKAKRGFAQAYVAGFREAMARGYDVIVQMDCDLSHPVDYLPEFLRQIEDHDEVIGSRYTAGGATRNWPLHRWLVSKGGNFYARWILGAPMADLTGGFKCWRRSALERIGLEHVRARGFAFQMEMNYRAWRKGFRIAEIPIVFPNREEGESKMHWREFRESLLMPWRLLLRPRLS